MRKELFVDWMYQSACTERFHELIATTTTATTKKTAHSSLIESFSKIFSINNLSHLQLCGRAAAHDAGCFLVRAMVALPVVVRKGT